LLQVEPRDLRAADHRSLDIDYRILDFRGHEIPRVIAWRSIADSGVVALGRCAAPCWREKKAYRSFGLDLAAVDQGDVSNSDRR
jgi:hypothetical protein